MQGVSTSLSGGGVWFSDATGLRGSESQVMLLTSGNEQLVVW